MRFIQADDNTCIVDGTIDGLSPGLHGLHVHEFGDISEGCDKYVLFAGIVLFTYNYGLYSRDVSISEWANISPW